METDSFFALVDGQVVPLESLPDLPSDLLRALASDLESVLGQPVMAVGSWADNSSDGPLVLGINRAGQLVSLIAVTPSHLATLSETISSMDQWLATLDLRSLADLSGNPVVFYEGLLDLSPESSIVLSPRRKYVLATALDQLDTERLKSALPTADIAVRYLDVLQAPGGTAIFRSRPEGASPISRPETEANTPTNFEPVKIPRMPASPSPEIPDDIVPLGVELDEAMALDIDQPDAAASIELDEPDAAAPISIDEPGEVALTETPDVPVPPLPHFVQNNSVLDVTDPQASETIDLDELEVPTPPGPQPVSLQQGMTYELDELPLLFDATGETLESISNELFAVGDSIVIVVELPERRRATPFEERRKFRWDTSLDRIQLLNDHGLSADGERRTVHLFVEAARFGSYAMYVGELSRTAFQTQVDDNAETAWFSISPSLPYDLYRTLRKGRLPEHRTAAIDA